MAGYHGIVVKSSENLIHILWTFKCIRNYKISLLTEHGHMKVWVGHFSMVSYTHIHVLYIQRETKLFITVEIFKLTHILTMSCSRLCWIQLTKVRNLKGELLTTAWNTIFVKACMIWFNSFNMYYCAVLVSVLVYK